MDAAIQDILQRLRDLGVHLYPREGKLAYVARKGGIPGDLRDQVQKHKEGIIQALLDESDVVEERTAAATHASERIPIADRSKWLPLSYGQQRLWFVDQLVGRSPQYNLSVILEISAEIDFSLLEAALNLIVSRHEVLRTSVDTVDGKGVQVVHELRKLDLEHRDISHLAPSEQELYLHQTAVTSASWPFCLSDDLLLRGSVLSAAADRHYLLLTMHHIVSDAWSMDLLVKEFSLAYQQLLNGLPVELPALPVQYADFAVWQREEEACGRFKEQLSYWVRTLENAPAIHSLPLDKERPEEQDFEGQVFHRYLPDDLVTRLQKLAQREQVTLFILLQTAFALLVARWSSVSEVNVGVPVAGRSHSDVSSLIGFFINSLAIRTELPAHASFVELLEQNKARILEALDNQDVPFDLVVDALGTERSLSYTPVFQILFTLIRQDKNDLLLRDMQMSVQQTVNTSAKFDVEVTVVEGAKGVQVQWIYASRIFSAETIERLAASYQQLLTSICDAPRQSIHALQLLPQSDWEWLASQFEQDVQPSAGTIHELFENQVKLHPTRVAVSVGGASMTYSELNREANKIANWLRDQGVTTGCLVGIYLQRSENLLPSVLGVLKSGAAYLPLDPNQPMGRLRTILADASPTIVVTEQSLSEVCSSLYGRRLIVDQERGLDQVSVENPRLGAISGEELAYVIYTSGSTGTPKGALLCHKNSLALIAWARSAYTADELSGVLAGTSIGFDLSVFEFFVPLSCGGSVILVESVLSLLERPELKPSLINTVPTAIKGLTDGGWKPVRPVTINLAGEPLHQSIVNQLLKDQHCSRVLNLYGPTEDCTYSTAAVFSKPLDRKPSIGKPIEGTIAVIVSPAGEPLPRGCVGELLLGGAGVAKGYLNRPALTAERFLELEVAGCPISRFYRTGDLARYTVDGELDFLGRMDDQVKIRGHRLELGEVEAHIKDLSLIEDAAVVLDSSSNSSRLVAFVVLRNKEYKVEDDAKPSPGVDRELRNRLVETLPDYMIPTKFIVLRALPETPNGKIDKRQLTKTAAENRETEDEVTKRVREPRSDVESVLLAVWKNVLQKNDLSIDDNFFAVGGDSILSIQVVAESRRRGMKLATKDIFNYGTIAELAEHIAEAELPAPDTAPVEGEQLLLPMQQSFLRQNGQYPHHYNQMLLLRSGHDLPEPFLKEFAEALVARHDALRLRFTPHSGTWKAEYSEIESALDSVSVSVECLPVFASQQELEDYVRERCEHMQEGLHICSGPLMKLAVFADKASGDTHLFWVAHHLIVDGISWRILLADLKLALAQKLQGQSLRLDRKTDSLQSWGRWLERESFEDRTLDEVAYWQSATRPTPQIATDLHPDHQVLHSSTAFEQFTIDRGITENLVASGNLPHGTTVHELLLAAVRLAFSRWSQQEEIRCLIETHGRECHDSGIDLTSTIGWFTAAYPLIFDLREREVGKVIEATKEQHRQVPRGGLGYGLLARFSGRLRARADTRPDLVFNFFGYVEAGQEPDLFRLVDYRVGNAVSTTQARDYVIGLNSQIAGGKLMVSLDYSVEEYHEESIRALVRALQQSIKEVASHCKARKLVGRKPGDFPSVRLSQAAIDAWQAKYEVEDIYACTPLQQGMLFHSEMDSSNYIVQIEAKLEGSLDVSLLEKAWEHVVSEQAVLRTIFGLDADDEMVQIVLRSIRVPAAHVDLSALTEAEQASAITEARRSTRASHFRELSTLPFKLHLFKLSAHKTVQLWSFRHAVLDGWSATYVLTEVLRRYHLISAGSLKARQLSKSRFRDYVEFMIAAGKRDNSGYWKSRMAGAFSGVPGGSKGEAAARTEKLTLTLSPGKTRALKELAQKQRVTLNVLVQSTWIYLLEAFSGSAKVAYGTTFSLRPAEIPDIEAVAGLFIATVPMVFNVDDEELVGDFLQRVHQELVLLEENAYSPLTAIRRFAEVDASTPLFETLVVFRNYPVDRDAVQQAVGVGPKVSAIEAYEDTHYPLSVIVDCAEELRLQLEYDPGRVDYRVVRQLASSINHILESLGAHLSRPLTELPLLDPRDERFLIEEINDTQIRYEKNFLIHQLFERQEEAHPQLTALTFKGRSYTYSEINRRANRLAAYLVDIGVKPGDLVGLCLDRGPNMIVGLLAVLKAGGAYVPVDSAYTQRLPYVVRDSGMSVLLTQTSITPAVAEERLTHVELDCPKVKHKLAGYPDMNPGFALQLDDVAYVTYTSGSTGEPKGVVQTHRTINNLVQSLVLENGVKGCLRTLQFTSIGFDVSIMEVATAWHTGSDLVLLDQDDREDMGRLLMQIEASQVARVFMAFSVFQVMATEALAHDMTFPHLRQIVTGSERVQITESISAFMTRHPKCSLWNEGGPTETHSLAAHKVKDLSVGSLPPIGRPRANMRAYILNNQQKVLPFGAVGELYIAGAGVAKGYLNKPEIARRSFLPNPLTGSIEDITYRTGDLARFNVDGEIEILGRVDQQVKIHGYRVEPEEIEIQINRLPYIQQSVVVLHSHPLNGKRLVAYFSIRNKAQQPADVAKAVARALHQQLPHYMVPAVYVEVQSFPMTTTGKLDRKALPEPTFSHESTEVEAPQTRTEVDLARLWQQVIGGEIQVGCESKFFELGGHSLKMAQLASRIRRVFEVEVSVRDLYEAASLRDMALAIDSAVTSPDKKRLIKAAANTNRFPLSFAQQRLWFLQEVERQSTTYLICAAYELEGTLDFSAMTRALHKLMHRHAALRTRFVASGTGVCQEVMNSPKLPVSIVDMNDVAVVRECVLQDRREPMDLTEGPMWKCTFYVLGSSRVIVSMVLHHAITDAWSEGIIRKEFIDYYLAEVGQKALELPPLPLQYGDFAQWQRSNEHEHQRGLAFWRDKLKAAPRLHGLSLDKPRSPETLSRGAWTEFEIPDATLKGLGDLCASTKTTLYSALMTAFSILLARLGGQSEVVIGTSFANRPDPDLERVVGLFVNTVPIVNQVAGNSSFSDNLQKVQANVLEAQQHQNVPFDKIVADLKLSGATTYHPIFQIFFVLQNAPSPSLEVEGFNIKDFAVEDENAMFDMMLDMKMIGRNLVGRLNYNTELFTASTVEGIAEKFLTILQYMISQPHSEVDDFGFAHTGQLPKIGRAKR